MNVENNDVLKGWLREHGYASLAELPSFEVPQEEYEKHLADVQAQGLHSDEGSNQARAVYRCLTSHLGAADKRPAAQDSIATHLDRTARLFNQSIAVLAGKTEAHAKIINAARDAILEKTKSDAAANLQQVFSGLAVLHSATHDVHIASERRWRQTIWTVVLGFALVLLLLGVLAVRGHAQAGQPADDPKPVVAKPAPKPDLGIPDAYLIKLRNLQVQQDKIVLRLKNSELQEKQAQLDEAAARAEIKSFSDQIQSLAYQLAVEKHLNVKEWLLDLDTLTWQPKPKEKKP